MDDTSPPPITTKPQLVAALQEAAQLEHEFMCQYLYAAFSLKKNPDATCNDAQFECVRRWASAAYMIARQEMEHLSIANSLLTAIGAPPVFDHDNFPAQVPWYAGEPLARKLGVAGQRQPCPLPFVLHGFDLSTVRRFTCMESPSPADVPAPDLPAVDLWCFQDEHGQCGCVDPSNAKSAAPRDVSSGPPLRPTRFRRASALTTEAIGGARGTDDIPDIEIGSIQELYAAIRTGFVTLNESLGADALFSGHLSGQQEIPSEYNIYLFPICDLSTSLAGIDLITRQGEGIDAPPGSSSHFTLWLDMAREYAALLDADASFQPARVLPTDPTPSTYAGDPLLEAMVGLYNDGYLTLLYMLTGFYAGYTKSSWQNPPFLSQALEQTAFAPAMTMLIRSLAELIVQLPWDAGFAGPTFQIPPEARALLEDPDDPRFGSLAFYHDQMAVILAGLDRVQAMKPPAALQPRLLFITQNMTRVQGNLSYIYNRGTFPNFDPSTNASCPPDEGCGQ